MNPFGVSFNFFRRKQRHAEVIRERKQRQLVAERVVPFDDIDLEDFLDSIEKNISIATEREDNE